MTGGLIPGRDIEGIYSLATMFRLVLGTT